MDDPARTAIDVDLLAHIIAEVEHSHEVQALPLTARAKARVIAELYASALAEGRAPDQRTTDRMVWLVG